MLGRNKTVNYAVAGIALASVALLAYTVTRPTRRTKKGRKRRSGTGAGSKSSKKDKYTVTLEKPIDMHLVMETLEGFNAHVAGDKKNTKLKLPFGARLIRINKKNVEGLTYGEIMEALTKAKSPLTLQFRKNDALCAQWKRAETVKEAANTDFKAKQIASAVSNVSAAIELHSTNRVYYSNRILMLLQTKDYEAALRDCQRIRELDPRSTYIKGHYLRGLTLFHLERYKNAASAFQTVLKLNSDFKKAAGRLEECLAKLKEQEKAEKQRRDSQNELLTQQFAAKQQQKEAEAEVKEQEQEQSQSQEKADEQVGADAVLVDSEQKKSEVEVEKVEESAAVESAPDAVASSQEKEVVQADVAAVEPPKEEASQVEQAVEAAPVSSE